MKINLSLLALPVLLTVAACGSDKPEVIDRTPADPMADALNNAAAIELPPMVQQSKTYRCKDSSLIYVDFMSDNKTVMLKTEKEGVATKLTKAEADQPYTAEGGYSLAGSPDEVTVEMPGKGKQTCKS